MGKANHLTWEQAKEMCGSDLIDIQSHTVSHSDLTELSDKDLNDELMLSRYAIQNNLNLFCEYAAYPYGSTDERIAQKAKEVVYMNAFVLYDEFDVADNSFAIKRYTKKDNLRFNSLRRLLNIDETHSVGDINGDGIVNAVDNAFLSRYFAKWTEYDGTTVDLSAADTNNDTKVTALDNAILSRHLAKWTGYDALPYIK